MARSGHGRLLHPGEQFAGPLAAASRSRGGRKVKKTLAAAAGLLITMPMVGTVPAFATAPVHQTFEPRIVAGNLNNPRQLTWARTARP
jgi:hypothetical protein